MIKYLKKNSLKNKNVIIGNFDLIHKKHLELFNQNTNYVILSFSHIPRKEKTNIHDLKAKNYFLTKFSHASNIYYLDLRKHNMDAETFFNTYLKQTKSIIVGRDFCFGNDFVNIGNFSNQANIQFLGYDKNYSSTQIKSLLRKAKIVEANNLLTHPFAVYKKVVHGKKIGRTLGFRTANFTFYHDCFIKPGIYLTKTIYKNKIYKSVTMFGKPQTLKNTKTNIMETHLINFNKIIYNKYIEVQFYKYLGPVKKLSSKDELIKAISSFKEIAEKTNY